ncbi:MAG: PHP domain-containing protein [Bacillota bacterium]
MFENRPLLWTGDFHTHSKYSDGRASIEEMVDAARSKGLKNIAITDHGPANIGTGVKKSDTYLKIKEEINQLQQKRPDIRILTGAEADIISCQGDIDISDEVVRELDILLVGLHPYVKPKSFIDGVNFVLGNQAAKLIPFFQSKVKNINTKALVEALHKYPVTAVTHPGLGMPLDLKEVARACLATDTAFEINTGHNYQKSDDIKEVAKSGVSFIVNSDAHFTETVGYFDPGLALLKDANVPLEQIINLSDHGEDFFQN